MKNLKQHSYRIARGVKSDLEQIWQLDNLIFKKSDRFSQARFRYLLSSPNAVFFVCTAGERCVGYGIALRNKLRNGKVKGRIYSIAVLPEWQNKGIGTLILEKLEDWLIKAESSFITLETRAGRTAARRFFEEKGYKFSEDLPGYYEPANGVRMKKIDL